LLGRWDDFRSILTGAVSREHKTKVQRSSHIHVFGQTRKNKGIRAASKQKQDEGKAPVDAYQLRPVENAGFGNRCTCFAILNDLVLAFGLPNR